jgi:hypothetical protein
VGLIIKMRFGRAMVEDFLHAAGLDEIRRPLNGIFLTPWKDADADISILIAAKAEYAKLQ